MKPTYLVVCAVVLLTGCGLSDEERRNLGSEARKARGTWPATFDSLEAATVYAHAAGPGGGRVDQVQIDGSNYLIAYSHGSGVPVVGIAVYGQNVWRHWVLIAKPPRPHFSEQLLPARVIDGKIFVVGRLTMKQWQLHDPSKPNN